MMKGIDDRVNRRVGVPNPQDEEVEVLRRRNILGSMIRM